MSVSDDSLAELIAGLQRELEPLHRAANDAFWQLNVTGEKRWEEESTRLKTEIRTILSRPEPFQFLRQAAESEGTDPVLRRQAALLANEHTPHQISEERIQSIARLEDTLMGKFTTFRAELDGEHVSDNHIREILDGSQDVALRQRVWEASMQIGAEVAGELVELVRMRNAGARELGYRDYYSMALEVDELDEDEVFDIFDRVIEGSQEPLERYKRELDEATAGKFGIGVEELRPWHYPQRFLEPPSGDLDLDPWFEKHSVEKLATEYFDSVGFDIGPVLSRSDLYEREGKCQHAFCLDLDRAGDVRLLCNLRPNEFWASVLLHELGHAVYDDAIDRALPYFLRTPAHTFVTEASAMLFERLTRTASWLVRYTGMAPEEAQAREAIIGKARSAHLLSVARTIPLYAHMERALYRDPEQDLNALWWEFVARFQLLTGPDGRDAPDWAAKIHFSAAPAYFQNYLLGEIVASQLQAHLLDEVGGGANAWERYVQSPEVGSALSEQLYRQGRSTDWRAAVERATGEPLDPAPLLAEVDPLPAPLR